jgi:hypothetical protein
VQLLRCHYVSRFQDCGKEILQAIDSDQKTETSF